MEQTLASQLASQCTVLMGCIIMIGLLPWADSGFMMTFEHVHLGLNATQQGSYTCYYSYHLIDGETEAWKA